MEELDSLVQAGAERLVDTGQSVCFTSRENAQEEHKKGGESAMQRERGGFLDNNGVVGYDMKDNCSRERGGLV